MMPALSCEHLTVRYDGSAEPTLRNISMDVAPGEHVALLGNNGSGKSTLLLAAVGLLPHEGIIAVCGTILTRESAGVIRRSTGFLFPTPEDQILFPRVIDDVAFSLTNRGMPRKEAIARSAAMLEQLGIGPLAQEAPFRLSHGQRLRVALAGVLVASPPLLLLDEPSASLDPPGREQLIALLAPYPAAMLVATHDREFAGQTCSRSIVLENGRLT